MCMYAIGCEKVPGRLRLRFQKRFFFLTASLFFASRERATMTGDP